jgi:hypothetical protein
MVDTPMTSTVDTPMNCAIAGRAAAERAISPRMVDTPE